MKSRKVVSRKSFRGVASTGILSLEAMSGTGGNDETVRINLTQGQFEFSEFGRCRDKENSPGVFLQITGEWEIKELVGALQRVYGDCREWVLDEAEEAAAEKRAADEFAAMDANTEIPF